MTTPPAASSWSTSAARKAAWFRFRRLSKSQNKMKLFTMAVSTVHDEPAGCMHSNRTNEEGIGKHPVQQHRSGQSLQRSRTVLTCPVVQRVVPDLAAFCRGRVRAQLIGKVHSAHVG